MKKKLVIMGAGGHGKVVSEIAFQSKKYEEIIFLDDNKKINKCGQFSVVGTFQDVENIGNQEDIFVAVGNNSIRKIIIEKLLRAQYTLVTIIHPSSVLANNIQISVGTVIMPGVIVNNGSTIGTGVILNTGATVDHDCIIEDFSHVSVGCHLAGNVIIGQNTFMGIGSVVINNISIGGNCIIGAGAVVTSDIETSGTYTGVPARKRKW